MTDNVPHDDAAPTENSTQQNQSGIGGLKIGLKTDHITEPAPVESQAEESVIEDAGAEEANTTPADIAQRATPAHARLDPEMFPDQPPTKGSGIPTTIDNVRHLLHHYGVEAKYNVIKKKLEIAIPGIKSTTDNADNVTVTHLMSLAARNGLNIGMIGNYVAVIGDENAYNPVEQWIRSKPWDGEDRLPAFYDTLKCAEGYDDRLKRVLMRKWALSAVAAALMTSGFRSRGVLTLQGRQGLGKTSWGRSLVPDPVLCASVVKTDHHLDGGNKDSITTAVSHWLVEVGELESSFRRDVSRLKGFLTADSDKVRRPYARIDSEYPRRTVFYATVNASQFLVDDTGNTRWWTLPVEEVNFNHGIDMQQLFAQLAVDVDADEEWWLNEHQERMLEHYNRSHRSVSVVAERLAEIVDMDGNDTDKTVRLTASGLLRLSGIDRPSNAQAKECGAILRELYGEPKKIRGEMKWPVRLRPERFGHGDDVVDVADQTPQT